MLSYAIFFLLLALITGVLMLNGTLGPVIFSVALAAFLGSGFAYMRERYRGSRR
jgi:hypothetical protein